MKLAMTREWFERRAAQEGNTEIAAGALAQDPLPEPASTTEPTTVDTTRLAFGSLVELKRREFGMTREMLANDVGVDLTEIVSIERDAHFRPEPRTVYNLASKFKLPNKALQQLSGNATIADNHMSSHALRFAARSGEQSQALSPEQKHALEEFVAYLARL
jgi:HTH-type transcriptional regulator, competence development regulator